MTASDVTYIDSTPITPEGWENLPTHVHVRGSGVCVKHEDGPLCENDPEALRERLATLETWATQALINLYLIANKPQGGVLPSATFRDTLTTFVGQAPAEIRAAGFATLTEVEGKTVVLPCQVCNGSGWWGARRHDPAHYASHIHCDACENPCQACAAGDGFKAPR